MRHMETFRLIEAVARAGSIRKAAEDTAITASALNRRIQRFEQEFGYEIFERLTTGMRLNPAGELVLQHYRGQNSDLQRIRSQAADLSGVRRGKVTIAASQALIPYFLPHEIAAYRRAHPAVTFEVNVRDRSQAEKDLASFNSDLALVFEPVHMVDFQILYALKQPVCAIFAEDHPLARRPGLRLRDCVDFPHVVPRAELGVRSLLDAALKPTSRRLSPVLETDSFELIRHYVLHEGAVGFHIPVGLEASPGLTLRRIPERDLPAGNLFLGQMKGRSLPVASSRFAEQVVGALRARETEFA
ncbi:LysR family transcriptional regulator [Acidimangrovimonas sediminis]|uniref:LysR family transcriptional regulator n=1 Tax=Acidimangrovimonas sediminis TaxID=2056283 RepID=UPI000C8094E5|nr:LysR family transcriptional regulator [Acidimangrovimonas sediminis]